MHSTRPSVRFRTTLALLGATLSAATLATPASAHETAHWPITGDSLQMTAWPEAPHTGLKFKTKAQININLASLAEDPTVEESTLTVIGAGAVPGESGVVHLKKANWSRIGTPESPKGWKYKAKSWETKGVTKILIKNGAKGGSLQIQAKEGYWPFDIHSSQDSIDIVLSLGTTAFCAKFSTATSTQFDVNEPGTIEASLAPAPDDCPQICGNGVTELPEQCDDANTEQDDTCTNECTGCNAIDVQYASTYDAIQDLIFDNPAYNCTNSGCHGSVTPAGSLDLRAGNSYAALVGTNGVSSVNYPSWKRVFPGDQDLSLLYAKLADRTNGTSTAPGSPMPQSASPLSAEHLEALRLWIRGGAPETGVVSGTAELLGSCLPAPTPLDIPQPPVPDPSVGVQLPMPGYTLYSNSEVEGCLASYYDVSATVPPSMMVDCPNAFPGTNETGLNAGKCFAYKGNSLYQDAQSHHSIIHIYKGTYPATNSGWGSWRCYGGPHAGDSCVPTDGLDTCDSANGGVCGSAYHLGVACLPTQLETWGAPDFSTFGNNAPQFSGSQESTANFATPDGVYSILPLKGLVVWNSHAFNLTGEDTQMNAWLNMTYTDQQTWPAQGLFDSTWIFTQHVLPYQQKEYCETHTFPDHTKLFQLSSHTHKHGIRWRYYKAPQTPCGPGSGGDVDPNCLPGSPSDIFYESYDYSDPLTMNFDPPMEFTGTVPDRTIKFCAVFDNGLTSSHVKRRSTSPVPVGNFPFGGPCGASYTYCYGGTNPGTFCGGNDALCEGGGVCDACELLGGVTTEDEMFIALGSYYIAP